VVASPQAPSPPVGNSPSAAEAPKKPPYVNIRRERPLPEDLTPTVPREAIAYLEDRAAAAAAATASKPEVEAAQADDDPDAGWDDDDAASSSPLVPQVPVVLASSSPSLVPLPPPPTPSPRSAVELRGALELLAEVDDALPTPAINGLPAGVVDAVPIPRGPEASFTAPFLLYGPTPPPPTPAPVTVPLAAPAPSNAPPPAAADPPAPLATTSSSDDLPVVPAPPNRNKTQKIVVDPNAPRLVPEVMTPALLSAGPYRGEVHLEASSSSPVLPAVPGLLGAAASPSVPAPMMPGLLRDAQPTVAAQHRVLEAAAKFRHVRPIGGALPSRAPFLAAAALGAFLGVLGLGTLALGIGPASPPPMVRSAALPVARAMLTALRDVDGAPARGIDPGAAPTFHSATIPVAAPSPAMTAPEAPKRKSAPPAEARASARRAVGAGRTSSDGF
jgi:hypothetical protein